MPKAWRMRLISTWNSVLRKDILAFGKAFRASFEAQVAMFPHMVNDEVLRNN